MNHNDFEYMKNLISKKIGLQREIDNLQKKISDINCDLSKPVAEIFKPLIGRYFHKTGTLKNPESCNDWFIITDAPKTQWMMIGGCYFNECQVCAKIMGADGMPRRGTIGISPENFQNDGTSLPEYIVEVTEDEWFEEQRRRVHEEADRKLKESMFL